MQHEHTPGSPEDWLSRAKGKLALARQTLPEGGYWEDLCFMAQQAAELGIKAVYQTSNWKFAFVHDLRQLLDSLDERGVAVPDSIRKSERLSIYASQMRYPGMSSFTTEEEYKRLLAIAEDVVAWAENIVNA